MINYIKTTILITAAPLFLVAAVAHIIVKLKMRPKADAKLDDYYHEIEFQNPSLAKYEKYSRITYITAIVAIIMLFIAIAL